MKALKRNRDEIIYNIVNSFLAGALVFLGACSTGGITKQGALVALVTSGVVAVTKFKDYWGTQESEYSKKIFKFL